MGLRNAQKKKFIAGLPSSQQTVKSNKLPLWNEGGFKFPFRTEKKNSTAQWLLVLQHHSTSVWIRKDEKVSSVALEKVGQVCKSHMNFLRVYNKRRNCLDRWYFSYINLYSSVGSIILSRIKEWSDHKDGKPQLNLQSTVIQHNTQMVFHGGTWQDRIPWKGRMQKKIHSMKKTWQVSNRNQNVIETWENLDHDSHTMDSRDASNIYAPTWG